MAYLNFSSFHNKKRELVDLCYSPIKMSMLITYKRFYVKYFYLWDDSRPVYMWFLVNMFDKKFFDTPEGLKQLLAYELYVTYGLYQKEIAKLLGCSNNTVANHVKKINKYNHLKDFKSVRESKKNQVEQAFKTIKNEI